MVNYTKANPEDFEISSELDFIIVRLKHFPVDSNWKLLKKEDKLSDKEHARELVDKQIIIKKEKKVISDKHTKFGWEVVCSESENRFIYEPWIEASHYLGQYSELDGETSQKNSKCEFSSLEIS